MEPRQPMVVILGGPNGAGKSTAAPRVLPTRLDIRQYVNADDIARGLSAFAPESVALTAGRLMLQRLRELAHQRQDFAFETTMASRTFAPFLEALGMQGYHVHAIYLWIGDPRLALARVAARVAQGGHNVPEDVVLRRYQRGLANFVNLYRPLASSWAVYDNTNVQALRMVAYGYRNAMETVIDREVYDGIEQAAQRHA